jgi:hypothetical protein
VVRTARHAPISRLVGSLVFQSARFVPSNVRVLLSRQGLCSYLGPVRPIACRLPGWSAWLCWAAVMLCCTISHAQIGCGSRAWIAIDFTATGWPSTFCDTVLADLKASLGERQIDVCQVPTPTTAPIARITLTSPKPLTAGIVVVAADATATKRASRTVSLDSVPADGRAFAVALATDELLSASWDQLALVVPASAKPEPEPLAAPLVVAHDGSLPNNTLGLFALGDVFFGGQSALGGEVHFSTRLGVNSPLSLDVALGASLGLSVETSNGSISSDALLGGVWLRHAWRERAAFSFGLSVGTRVSRYRFFGHPPADQTIDSSAVETSSASDWVYSFGARGDTRVALSRAVGLNLAIDVGLPISGIEITDTEQVATGTTGLRLTPSLGLVVQW